MTKDKDFTGLFDRVELALAAAQCQTPHHGKLNAMAHDTYDKTLAELKAFREADIDWEQVDAAIQDIYEKAHDDYWDNSMELAKAATLLAQADKEKK